MRWLAGVAAILLAACAVTRDTPPDVSARVIVSEANEFDAWIGASPARAAAFQHFAAWLTEAGVADVVPAHQLWLVDRLRPECVTAPFVEPPEAEWARMIPTLEFIRDHIEPAIGKVRVVSAYRDEAFNACIRGAPQSAHRGFFALDLVPMDASISREDLIARLCPIHAGAGARAHIGMGIYAGTRFHIDARGFRGWGPDYHRTTFPCDAPPT